MKQKLRLVAMCLVMAVAAMAERKTVQLRVPDMECETWKGKVEKVLAYGQRVRDLSFDIKKREERRRVG